MTVSDPSRPQAVAQPHWGSKVQLAVHPIHPITACATITPLITPPPLSPSLKLQPSLAPPPLEPQSEPHPSPSSPRCAPLLLHYPNPLGPSCRKGPLSLSQGLAHAYHIRVRVSRTDGTLQTTQGCHPGRNNSCGGMLCCACCPATPPTGSYRGFPHKPAWQEASGQRLVDRTGSTVGACSHSDNTQNQGASTGA